MLLATVPRTQEGVLVSVDVVAEDCVDVVLACVDGLPEASVDPMDLSVVTLVDTELRALDSAVVVLPADVTRDAVGAPP